VLNLFGVFVVDVHESVICRTISLEQLVELSMDGLRVSVLRSE
jgi:hypothetical protein